MVSCQICNKTFKNNIGLVNHINHIHKINSKDYYDKYLKKENEHLCEDENCNNVCNFMNITKGYCKYCSTQCSKSSDKTKEKIKKTFLNNYGVSNPSQNKKVQEKKKATFLKKYGVDNPFKDKDIQEQIKQTNTENLGVENPFQSKEIKDKIKKTNLEKYGVSNPAQNEEIQNKAKKTNLDRYGVENPAQNKEIQEKARKTNLKRYGVSHPVQNKEVRDKIKKTKFKASYDKISNSKSIYERVIPLFCVDDYDGYEKQYDWQCVKCGNIFQDGLKNKIPRCLECYPVEFGYSMLEKEITDFCKQFFPNLIENDRQVIGPYELDIYIPEINLAVEFNGLYWHSEINGNKDSKYHYNKYKLCKNKNINLIQIFEDEWIEKKEIVKSILLNKFNKIDTKIHARKCEIKTVSEKEKKLFLEENHLQGNCNSKFNIGLYYKNELVSLLTFGKSRFNKNYDYEILRFCNKINVVVNGSFSKLLKYFIKLNNINKVVTYCDLRYGEGGVYSNSGFKFKNTSKPSYFYIKNGTRYNRIKFQFHKLKKSLKIFDSNLTEWENMQLNGYDRIWDCGCNVYVY